MLFKVNVSETKLLLQIYEQDYIIKTMVDCCHHLCLEIMHSFTVDLERKLSAIATLESFSSEECSSEEEVMIILVMIFSHYLIS